MAGSIAGARHRAAVIPTRWLDALEERAKARQQPRLARAVQPFLEDHLDLIPKGALDTLECLPGPPRR